MKFKHIIWDWNGTLLNDAYFTFLKTCEVLKHNNLTIPNFDYYQDHFIFPIEEFLIPLGLKKIKNSLEDIVEEFVALYNKNYYIECFLHDKIINILNIIKEHKIPQYILSAREQGLLIKDMNYYEINDYFAKIMGTKIGGSHIGKLKQAKELIDLIEFEKDKIVIIGDTVHDFFVAKNFGIECILIATGQNSLKRLSDTGAKIIFKNHIELLDYFTNVFV